MKYQIALIVGIFLSFESFSIEQCHTTNDEHEVCINIQDAKLKCDKNYKGYFSACSVKVIYDVFAELNESVIDDDSIGISTECNSEIEYTSAFSSVYNGVKSENTYETSDHSSFDNSHNFSETMNYRFIMSSMDIKSVNIKSLNCRIDYVSKT